MPLKIDPERLRRAREARALSPEDLAERSGVGAIRLLEDPRYPHRQQMGTVRRIAEALGVEPLDIADLVDA